MTDPAPSIQFDGENEADTARLAAAVAATLRSGDAIILEGSLAAGKTYFIRCLCKYLGVKDSITSPTFTLAHFYKGDPTSVLHIDAYRLETPHEFQDLGLDEFFPDHITAVEWGAKVKSLLPPALLIRIEPQAGNDSARRFIITSDAENWRDRIPLIRQALKGSTP